MSALAVYDDLHWLGTSARQRRPSRRPASWSLSRCTASVSYGFDTSYESVERLVRKL
ncbi:MAG: hypothetical protein AAF628_34830 [Planctomycetota bacterium]